MSEFADTFLRYFLTGPNYCLKGTESYFIFADQNCKCVSPISIIAVCGAGQVKLSKHKRQIVLGGEAAVYNAVRCCDRPVGSDQGGSAT